MRMYTMEYDCNLPTVQQINVPTNSDYKVGFGVTRNGKKSILSPAELTLTDRSETLSCDSTKTKGYPTVSMQSGSDASLKQYTVNIDKGYDFNDSVTCHGFSTSTTQISAMINSSDYDTDALGLVGMEVFAKDLYKGGNTSLDADSDDPADITNWRLVVDGDTANQARFIWKVKGDGTIDETTYYWPFRITAENWEYYGHPGHETGPGFFKVENGNVVDVLESVVIPSGYRLGDVGLRPKANKYYIMGWKFTAGTPYTASFTLNINTFKSQAADIAAATDGARTFNFSGEFADGTDFDYDVVVK